jgi:ABC-type antimicrobial peptide transport system permease subunit
MLRNYYRTAVRSIARNPFHASLNILSLATGIAFTLLVAAYTWGEWRVNRGLRNVDRQYFITTTWKDPNIGFYMSTFGPLAKTLRENYPSLVANYYRFDGITCGVSIGNKHFREGIQLGDSTLLTTYGFSLLQGDNRTALNRPFSIVITADMAIKYFGKTDAVGQNLTIENSTGDKKDFRVTGVLPLPTRNSVTWINEANNNRLFVPTANLDYFHRDMNWQDIFIANYIELQPGVSPDALQAPIAHILKVNAPPDLNKMVVKMSLNPLRSYYLTGNGGAVRKMIYTLSFVAFFILLMAVINFVNLSVSRSTARMKEIGIRKVLGGLRRQLVGQFLTESILLSVMATGIALLLYQLFAPSLGAMLGKEIPSIRAVPGFAWALIGMLAIFVGAVAGLYPAFVLSALPSVDSLKGRKAAVKENIFLRKGLVGFQFATATFVFAGAVIISQQISLFFSDQLGYDKDYVVSAQLPRDWTPRGLQRMETIRRSFAAMPQVKDVTLSYEIPDGNNGGTLAAYREGGDSSHAVVAKTIVSDEHFADTYRIPLLAGNFYNRRGESSLQDSFRIVLNETAARALGWKDPREAVRQRVHLVGIPVLFTVSGVTKDFHFGGMGGPIDPQVFGHISIFRNYRYFTFKLRPGKIAVSMAALQREWSSLLNSAPFDYKFMEETLRNVYTDELRLKKAATTSTGLALIIVLLGVVGMLSHSVQKRTKEIAIRKVIGASVPGIIRLFLREYLPLLLLAGLIASPLAYWTMHRWLNDYVTRIRITPWPFVAAIFSLGLVMVMLIIVQTVRVAVANPVKSLKAD